MDNSKNSKAFEDIRRYFDKKTWKEMGDYEKKHFCNKKRNHDALIKFGLKPELPDFMTWKWKKSLEEDPDGSTDSDEERTPKTKSEVNKKEITDPGNRRRVPLKSETFPTENKQLPTSEDAEISVTTQKCSTSKMKNRESKQKEPLEPENRYPVRDIQRKNYREPKGLYDDLYLCQFPYFYY